MSKQLKIKDPNSEQEYTLEFNRKTVREALNDGFDLDKMAEGDYGQMLMFPKLFNRAFEMHHGKMSEEETDAIYELLPNKTDFMGALSELFAEPINSLVEDPKGAKSKNFKWKKTW